MSLVDNRTTLIPENFNKTFCLFASYSISVTIVLNFVVLNWSTKEKLNSDTWELGFAVDVAAAASVRQAGRTKVDLYLVRIMTAFCKTNTNGPQHFYIFFVVILILKNGPIPASFSFIFIFSNTHYKFYNK